MRLLLNPGSGVLKVGLNIFSDLTTVLSNWSSGQIANDHGEWRSLEAEAKAHGICDRANCSMAELVASVLHSAWKPSKKQLGGSTAQVSSA